MIYQVANWSANFENNKSRERDHCSFVCVPNKQHGMGFCAVVSEPDGAAIYGIWQMILGACSQQKRPREGWLTSDGHQTGTPWAPKDLALKFRRPIEEIERALSVLCSESIGWINIIESARRVPAECPSGALEEKRREGNRIERREVKKGGAAAPPIPLEVQKIVDEWNGQKWFPKCSMVSRKRLRTLGLRLKDQYFRDNWQSAIRKAEESLFLRGENHRNWRASFDWFIQPDSCIKIMEGKYDNGTYRGNGQQGFDRSKGTANEGRAKDYNLEAIRKARAIPDVQRPAT